MVVIHQTGPVSHDRRNGIARTTRDDCETCAIEIPLNRQVIERYDLSRLLVPRNLPGPA